MLTTSQIKRKRRRSCHTTSSSSSPPRPEPSNASISKRSYNTRSQTRKRGLDHSTPEKPVTVEDFLQWSASTPTSKDKKKRHYVDINISTPSRKPHPHAGFVERQEVTSASSGKEMPQTTTSTEGISSSSPLPRQKSGTLSERMLRAAALSHVQLDSVAGLAHIVDPERPTLKFEAVPSSTLESGLKQPAKKKWRRRDPRRFPDILPEDFAPFSTATTARSVPRKSLDHWRPGLLPALPMNESPINKRKKTVALRDSPGPPSLSFVPIEPWSRTSGPSG